MSAGRYDIINAEQGATFARTLTYKDSEGAGIDITGNTFRMEVRTNFSDGGGDIILELTTENGGVVIEGAAHGIFSLNVSAEDMEDAVSGKYKYDLEMVSGAVVTRLLEGCFIIKPEVTGP